MKRASLVILVRGNRICLAEKKSAEYGTGTLNAYGGKANPGENPLRCAIRELWEEARVRVNEKDLTPIAKLTSFAFEPPVPVMEFFVYRADIFIGEPRETTSMHAPQWHDIDHLPFGGMNESDRHWLVKALRMPKHKVFRAELYYKEPLKGFISLKEVTYKRLRKPLTPR